MTSTLCKKFLYKNLPRFLRTAKCGARDKLRHVIEREHTAVRGKIGKFLKKLFTQCTRWRNGGALWGIVLIGCFSLLGPFFSGYAYDEIHLSLSNHPPSQTFWFGTDDLGRDIFTRVCYGVRISLFVATIAAIIDMFIGCLWGGISAFAGGVVDEIMMRIVDVLYSLPSLLVIILLMVMMGPGLIPLLIAMTLFGWMTMARIVRARVLQLKQEEFVLAAQTLGASFPRILLRHLLPNALGSILVTMTFTIPSAIFIEAFLSFLGLGIQAPVASLGTMANEGLTTLNFFPWRLFFPSFFICLTIFCFNLLGESLSDSLDTL